MIDLHSTLRTLAVTRPVFHSEADFQHALAWSIHERHPALNVRLEYRPPAIGRKVYVDIWLEDHSAVCAIELKYKTRRMSATVQGERFDLLNQGAHDVARYDVCKDISRVEAVVSAYPGAVGFAVFLTNDPGYWQRSSRPETVDAAFRLHDGAELRGGLSWHERPSAGTTLGRTDTLDLCGAYPVRWADYSESGKFRIMVVAVPAS